MPETRKHIVLRNQYNVVFSANAKAYAPTWMKAMLLTCLSLGVYYFWYCATKRAFIFSHTQFLAVRFHYHGTGKQALKASLPAVFSAMLIVAGSTMCFYAYHSWLLTSCLAVACAIPWLAYVKISRWQFLWANTTWGKKPISMSTTTLTFVAWYSSAAVLSLLSLGTLYPFFANKLFALRYGHLRCGDLTLTYTGKARDIYEDYVSHLPAIIVTLGFAYPFLHAKIARYRVTHLWLGGEDIGATRGYFGMRPKHYYELFVRDMIAMSLSAGIARPWLQINRILCRWSHFAFIGFLDFTEIIELDEMERGVPSGDALSLAQKPSPQAG